MDERDVQRLLMRASHGDVEALSFLVRSPLSNLFFVRLAALAFENAAPPYVMFTASVKMGSASVIPRSLIRDAALEIARWFAQTEAAPLLESLIQCDHGYGVINALATEATASDEHACAWLAALAVQKGFAALCMEGFGVRGWRCAPQNVQRMLLQAAFACPDRAVHGASAVWGALDDDHRRLAASMACGEPKRAAAFLQRIGVAGMRSLSPHQQRLLLHATMADPVQVSAASAAVWDALPPTDRAAAVQWMSGDPIAAADFVQRIGVGRWDAIDADQQSALLTAMLNHPSAAACGGGVLWAKLSQSQRARIDLTAAQSPASAACLVTRSIAALQEANLCRTDLIPRVALAALLIAANVKTNVVLDGCIAAWPLLSEEERQHVVNAVANSPQAPAHAALLVKGIARHWADTAAPMRRALVKTISASDMNSQAAGFVWNHLTLDEQTAIARVVGNYAPGLVAIIGREAWKTMDHQVRAELMRHLLNSPVALVRGAATIWSELSDDERRRLAEQASESAVDSRFAIEKLGLDGWDMTPPLAQEALLRSVKSDPEQAAHALIMLRDALSDRQRHALKRAVLGDEQYLTQQRPHKAPWR